MDPKLVDAAALLGLLGLLGFLGYMALSLEMEISANRRKKEKFYSETKEKSSFRPKC